MTAPEQVETARPELKVGDVVADKAGSLYRVVATDERDITTMQPLIQVRPLYQKRYFIRDQLSATEPVTGRGGHQIGYRSIEEFS